MMRRAAFTLSCIAVSTAFLGCGDDFPTDADPPALEVLPNFTGVTEGDTIRLRATLDGQPVTATWDVQYDSVATVSTDGLVTALPLDTATVARVTAVTASASGDDRSATVTVNPVTRLTSGTGVAVSSTGAAGSRLLRKIVVPAGRTSLSVTVTPGASSTGNVDLYVRRSMLPTPTVNDCASAGATNAETCTITNPAAGTWYISLVLRTAYSGATLTATVAP